MEVQELTVMVGSEQPERLATFYEEVLQLPRLSQYQDAVFRAGEANIRIIRHSRVAGRNLDPARVQLNLFVRDVREEAKRIERQGVSFVRRPEREEWGGVVATMEDPDGNYVQIIEEPRG